VLLCVESNFHLIKLGLLSESPFKPELRGWQTIQSDMLDDLLSIAENLNGKQIMKTRSNVFSGKTILIQSNL
jgi:hypothetical protein